MSEKNEWPSLWYRPPGTFVRGVTYLIRWFLKWRNSQISKAPRVAPGTLIVVVGNIVIGGTGKTPIVAELANFLRNSGLRVGIVSKGYRGRVSNWPIFVDHTSKPADVGDEPVLLAVKTGCPVVVCKNRTKAVELLAHNNKLDCILADDGMQNYQFWRDITIVVFNADQGTGNNTLIPFGPMRDVKSTVYNCDAMVMRDSESPINSAVSLGIEPLIPIFSSNASISRIYLQDYPEKIITQLLIKKNTFNAIAGIARPKNFFSALRRLKIKIKPYSFPDHYNYKKNDLMFDGEPIITTEKDALKLKGLTSSPIWIVAIQMHQEELNNWLLKKFCREKMQ